MHQSSQPADGDLTLFSAVEIAVRIRSGALSAAAVLEAFLARQAAINPHLNAIVTPLADQARATARSVDQARERGETLGSLAGVPMTVKDCFDLIGSPSTLGIGRRRTLLATSEGPVIERLRSAGAVIVGKTNVPQIMLMYETENSAFGRTPHPERDERGAGGSSGGEAAAVAARLSAVGLGSDLLGSIRQPAHACGIHGFKPTMQRASLLGTSGAVRGLESIVSQPGPMARHVCDITAVSRVLLAEPYDDVFVRPLPWREPQDVDVRGLRIGVWEEDRLFRPAQAVRRAVREAAEALAAAGAEVVPFAMPEVETGFRLCLQLLASGAAANVRRALDGEAPIPTVALTLRAWEMSPALRRIVTSVYDLMGQPWRAQLIRWCRNGSAAEYWRLVEERREWVRRVTTAWRTAQLDAIIAPPHGLPALLRGTSAETILAGSYSFVINLLGAASGTVAATRVRPGEETERPESNELIQRTARQVELGSAGLPIGVQVAALPGRDEICLAVMQALETHFSARPDYPPNSVPVATPSPVAQSSRG